MHVKRTGSSGPRLELELVDENGITVGTAEKMQAHQAPGHLHRAFSVFLFNAENKMLLQRRALSKYHSPGVWSNSCCGHPHVGEPPPAAAARRITEELGTSPSTLEAAGTVRYRHPDETTGLVEHEFNHLFVGTLSGAVHPHPDEIAEVSFVDPFELTRRLTKEPFSVWFRTVLQAAHPYIENLTGTSWTEA
ncbi:isopentenyl-diphosphate delta-isomerase [Actinoplanes lutulentus]|uniref:Isopentenyl-diphosphate Delta-isomerase n=1 Tax=Actinoplanes lutulentus TaxID=1287878 RepID=A0A327Z349_9ACTN|nr:isopentenyl-diphosphate delta-isomerase [Actinoplanes lutulentus]